MLGVIHWNASGPPGVSRGLASSTGPARMTEMWRGQARSNGSVFMCFTPDAAHFNTWIAGERGYLVAGFVACN